MCCLLKSLFWIANEHLLTIDKCVKYSDLSLSPSLCTSKPMNLSFLSHRKRDKEAAYSCVVDDVKLEVSISVNEPIFSLFLGVCERSMQWLCKSSGTPKSGCKQDEAQRSVRWSVRRAATTRRWASKRKKRKSGARRDNATQTPLRWWISVVLREAVFFPLPFF